MTQMGYLSGPNSLFFPKELSGAGPSFERDHLTWPLFFCPPSPTVSRTDLLTVLHNPNFGPKVVISAGWGVRAFRLSKVCFVSSARLCTARLEGPDLPAHLVHVVVSPTGPSLQEPDARIGTNAGSC